MGDGTWSGNFETIRLGGDLMGGAAHDGWPCCGDGAVGAKTVPAPIPVPPEPVDAVAPRLVEISPQDLRPEKLLEADNSPDPVKKAEPRKADNCGHCGKPLATLRSAASRYCDRYCSKAARKARATELPRYYRDA
jgi:hypothetical protein